MRPINKNNTRLTKRQLQAIETKKKIYDAAVQVINEKGFGNVSIEDITTRANVAKGNELRVKKTEIVEYDLKAGFR